MSWLSRFGRRQSVRRFSVSFARRISSARRLQRLESLESRIVLAQVAGDITMDTVWSLADSPYEVTGDIDVSAAATLLIEPGVVVRFRPATGLTVTGRLLAEGTPSQRIQFERAGAGKWSGITFDRTLSDNRLTYATLSSGDEQGEAINLDRSRLLIDNVIWTGTSDTVLELEHPSLIVRNSQFPTTTGAEVIHGEHLTGDEYLILDGNTFANSNNGGDVIDFLGSDRPGPVLQVLNNVFLGGGDDGLDLDGTDAHIEGNVFRNFRKNTSRATTSNAIATGLPQDGGANRTEITVVRNIFLDNDHDILLKEDAFGTIENNLFVNSRLAAVQFNEVGGTLVEGAGRGANLAGNIFANNAQLFKNLVDQPGFKTLLTVTQNWLPNEIVDFGGTPVNAHDLGVGNLAGDPQFVDPAQGDYQLQANSPAVGAGPWGRDMGAYVPEGPVLVARGPRDPAGNVTVDVGGAGITHYRYRLDDGALSGLIAVEQPIELQGLSSDAHTLAVVGQNSAGEWFTGQDPTWQQRSVQLIAPRRVRADERLPMIARGLDWQGQIDTTWSTQLALGDASSLSETSLEFKKGVATLSPVVQATEDFALSVGTTSLAIEVLPTDFPVQEVSGLLSGQITWTSDREYHIVGEVTIPLGSSLTIEPGTRVLLGDRVNFIANGTLRSQGTAADPVVFTARNRNEPWGGLEFRSGSDSLLQYTFVTNGGADDARNFGHSNSQPMIRAVASSVTCEGCYVIFDTGKGFGTTNARVEIRDSVVSNVDTGGEFVNSVVHVKHTWLTNIANATRAFVDDDNDGFYFNGVHSSGEASRFEDSYVINSQDDGIDHNGARLEIVRGWTQGTYHEGLAASSSNWVTVSDSVFTGSNQGVEAGYGGPDVNVSHSVLLRNRSQIDPNAPINAGLRFGDGYNGSNGAYTGHITAQYNVIYDNGDNVRNYDGQIQGPQPGAIDITSSLTNDADATDPSNFNGVPVLSPTLHLLRGSAGFTAGPEGMPVGRIVPAIRLTLPAVSSGDFNHSGQLDQGDIDLFCAALGSSPSDLQFDLTSDGIVDDRDRDALIFGQFHTTYGDANLDGEFNSADLVQIFVQGEYEDNVAGNSTWDAGDWNCDGEFSTQDLVLAFQAGGYK